MLDEVVDANDLDVYIAPGGMDQVISADGSQVATLDLVVTASVKARPLEPKSAGSALTAPGAPEVFQVALLGRYEFEVGQGRWRRLGLRIAAKTQSKRGVETSAEALLLTPVASP